MSTNVQKEVRIEVRLPKSDYPRAMFFNRFRVEREAEFCVVHFARVTGSGMLAESYCAVLPDSTLEQGKKSLLAYLDKIGMPKDKTPSPWQNPLAAEGADVVDFISMAFRGSLAETAFAVISMVAASRVARASSPDAIEAQPVILLRSTLEIQKQFLVALYEG